MTEQDIVRRFLFEELSIRGQWVNLTASYQSCLETEEYPQGVQKMLGDALAASVLLTGTIKSPGSLTLQVQGSGPVSLLVAQANSDNAVRAMAVVSDQLSTKNAKPQRLTSEDSRLAITLDPGHGRERYQGIVAMMSDTLADSVEDYFIRSEQLATKIWLSCAPGKSVSGLLLQQMPGAKSEDWEHITLLTQTLKQVELLELPVEQVLYRLYHQEHVSLFETAPVRYECSCSMDRVRKMIVSLGRAEADDVLKQEGLIEVSCDYCNKKYNFDAIDVAALFKPTVPNSESEELH